MEILKQKDPVCGMDVDVEPPHPQMEYEGNLYYFCSNGCWNRFREDPERYISGLGLRDMEHSAV